MIIIGQGAMLRDDAKDIYAAARTLAQEVGAIGKSWSGFNVLQTAASRVGALDIDFLPAKGGKDTAGILEATRNGCLLYTSPSPRDRG